jgi:hypothetical protein
MAMGKRKRDRQPTMWVPTTDLPRAASHPFYRRLNELLREHGFDAAVNGGAGGAKWLVSKGGGLRPRWSADSKQLIYATAGFQMMAVDIDASKGFQAGAPSPVHRRCELGRGAAKVASLAGFRSRGMMPCSWAASRAWVIWSANRQRASGSPSRPSCPSAHRSPRCSDG